MNFKKAQVITEETIKSQTIDLQCQCDACGNDYNLQCNCARSVDDDGRV